MRRGNFEPVGKIVGFSGVSFAIGWWENGVEQPGGCDYNRAMMIGGP